jgi:putative transposase
MAGGDPVFCIRSGHPQDYLHDNAIESLNRLIRKSIKTRGSFPTEETATKLIYLAIRNFEKGGRNVREWFAARNQFAIMFDERFDA